MEYKNSRNNNEVKLQMKERIVSAKKENLLEDF